MKHSDNSSEGHGAALFGGFLGWTLDAFDSPRRCDADGDREGVSPH